MNITVGSKTFTATLDTGPTVTAFRKLLPLTVTMADLNRNEKFVDLPVALPTNTGSPGRIQGGDLMLYGSRTLVVFYEPFTTTYRYTRLGRINDASGLAAALGAGDVKVTFTLQP
ncbi:cyclophilin-like fold protein [Deinococcus yunweiensis]|uniref:cyclophilin-like fold protein n=1 Tax=Deinococcus yunweiensis TaxID=367282 RepID=UPI00398EDAEE